jgi:ribonuclease III
MLFRLFPKAQEGELTQLRAQLVSTRSLATRARELNLGAHILMGKNEESQGGRDRENSLADVFEAILAAIYLDSGLEDAVSFVQRVFTPHISLTLQRASQANPKGKLQELIQSKCDERPVYTMSQATGPDHAKLFTVDVHWKEALLGQGIANTKREAEAQAAAQALKSPRLKKLLAELG